MARQVRRNSGFGGVRNSESVLGGSKGMRLRVDYFLHQSAGAVTVNSSCRVVDDARMASRVCKLAFGQISRLMRERADTLDNALGVASQPMIEVETAPFVGRVA